VTLWVKNFIKNNKVDDELYICASLWHDLIEDHLKNERKRIDSEAIEIKAKELKYKVTYLFDQRFIDNVFNIVKKLTKTDAQGYFDYVHQIYSGGKNLIEVASLIKNCDMIVNCQTSHVFSYVKQIKQFLKYFKKLNIDRIYLEGKKIDSIGLKLVYYSNKELSKVLYKSILNSLKRYETENQVSDEGRKVWKELALIYDKKYNGYSKITSAVTQKDIIYNPVKIFDGTISTFKEFLDPHKSKDIRKQLENKLKDEGKDYLALIGLCKLAEKFYKNPKFLVKEF